MTSLFFVGVGTRAPHWGGVATLLGPQSVILPSGICHNNTFSDVKDRLFFLSAEDVADRRYSAGGSRASGGQVTASHSIRMVVKSICSDGDMVTVMELSS